MIVAMNASFQDYLQEFFFSTACLTAAVLSNCCLLLNPLIPIDYGWDDHKLFRCKIFGSTMISFVVESLRAAPLCKR